MSNAIDLYNDNMKMFHKLQNTKTTIPTLEELAKKDMKN